MRTFSNLTPGLGVDSEHSIYAILVLLADETFLFNMGEARNAVLEVVTELPWHDGIHPYYSRDFDTEVCLSGGRLISRRGKPVKIIFRIEHNPNFLPMSQLRVYGRYVESIACRLSSRLKGVRKICSFVEIDSNRLRKS